MFRSHTRRLASVLSLLVMSLLLGCNTGTVPVQSYIQAHRNTHNLAGHIYQKFEEQNPTEAGAAADLYQSEELLISNAEKGVWPGSTTAPAK